MFTLDRFDVSVVNVLGTPLVASLTYSIINHGVASPPKGPISLASGSNSVALNETIHDGPHFELTLNITHDHYAHIKCAVRLDGQKNTRWNHRGVSVSISGSTLVVKVMLIRLRQAPVALIPKKLKADVVANPDKNVMPFAKNAGLSENALVTGVWNDPEAAVRQYWGLESIDRADTIRTIKNENGIPIKTANAEGWERFFFEDATVKLRDEGGFLWLEYGAVDSVITTAPRFLVGLWVPKKQGGKPLDVIVNFGHSPTAWEMPGTTFPYRNGPYPYSINKSDGLTPGHPQPYTHFGLSYFFQTSNFSFHFASQSIASKKPALVITPIFPLDPKQEIGVPFTNHQGLHRLLLEVKQFLIQEGFSEMPVFSFAPWQGKTAKTGSLDNISLDQNNFIAASPKPLKLGKISVCAHSSGLAFVTSLIKNKTLGKSVNYPFELFGASESEFESLWKELWDLDLSHFKAMPIADYLKLAVTWYKTGERVLRLYRSQHTFSTLNDFADIKKLTPLTETKSHGNATANYWHNDSEDVSLLTLNNGYTSTTKSFPGILPRFLGPGEVWFRYHQAPMVLGFGHACRMRVSS